MTHIVHGLCAADLFSFFPGHENGNITRLEVFETLPIAKYADSACRPKGEMGNGRWKLVEERRRTFRCVFSPVSVRVFWTEPYGTSRCWLFVDDVGKNNYIVKMKLCCCAGRGGLILNCVGRSKTGRYRRNVIQIIFIECPDTCFTRRWKSSRYRGLECARFYRALPGWLLQSRKILTEPRGQSTKRLNIRRGSRIPDLRLIESLWPYRCNRWGWICIRLCRRASW